MRYLMVLITVASSAHAGSLSKMNARILSQLKNVAGHQKNISQLCDKLESSIPDFNGENDAQHAEIAKLREIKKGLDERVSALTSQASDMRANYTALLGTIAAKKQALAASRGDLVKTLTKLLAGHRADLASVRAAKRKLGRLLADLDNFDSRDEFLSAVESFYRLKDRESMLGGLIREVARQLKSPTLWNETELRAEIDELNVKAKELYDALMAQYRTLKGLNSERQKLVSQIQELEKRYGALSNHPIPAICNVL